MDSITLENFINYCDEMMIAEESVLTDIKEKFIRMMKRLISVIQEIIVHCTKNKSVDVNSEFYDGYKSAMYSINNAMSTIDRMYINGEMSRHDVDRYNLSSIHENIKKLEELSATPNSSPKTLNIYDIFKEMKDSKDIANAELDFWNKLGDDNDKFEKLNHELTAKYLNLKVRVCTITYNKIKNLK